MEGYDQALGRLFYRTELLPGGMNSSMPKTSVPVESATEMSGCLTSLGHVIPGYAPTTLNWTLAETPRHFFTYFGYLETLVILCNTKAYIYTSLATEEKTPTTPFTSQTYNLWHGATLLHQNVPVAVINNYGIDRIHYYDGGAGVFQPITAAYQARTFTSWAGRLLTANCFVSGTWYVNRIAWSEINDITSWPFTGSSGYYDMEGDSDAIHRVALTSGNYLLIFRRKSIYLGIPNALYRNPLNTQFLSTKGIRATNSVQKFGSDHYYMGDSDIYKISGVNEPTSVGLPIRTELFALADASLIGYSWSFMDTVNQLYYLVVPQKDTSWRAWILNVEQGSWSFQTLTTISAIGEWYA